MKKELCIFACSNFSAEIENVIKKGGYVDVSVKSIDVHCMGPLINHDELLERIECCKKDFHKVVFFGSSCLVGMNVQSLDGFNIDFVSLNQCFDLILPPSMISYYLEKQCYIVSNGWFENYDQNINDWGFEPTVAKQFFQETSKSILFLDTSENSNIPEKLHDLSMYMGLPVEIVPVGIDYLKGKIDSIVLKWHVECEQEKLKHELALANKKNADYSMIFHQIDELLRLTDRDTLLLKIFTFFELMYAPQDIVFIPDKKNEKDWVWFKDIDSESLKKRGKFFNIPITFGSEALGNFRIYEVKFPKHIERYKAVFDIALAMIGLAFSNVKKFATIKRNELVLNKQADELKDHIEVKDRFFSIIAHDLRSPFNSILGLSKVLEEDYYDLDDEYRLSMLRKINHSANNYFQLLENLLEWASAQTGRISFKPDTIDFFLIVEDCIDLFDNACRIKGLRLKSSVSKGTMVYGDKNMLTSILRNLLSNAIKFTPSGGLVKIVAKDTKDDSSGFLRFCVKDTGVGMSKEQASKIFKQGQSYHTKGTENEPGSGLGLILVSEMIDYHKSSIVVESIPNKGSCFLFTLPNSESVYSNL